MFKEFLTYNAVGIANTVLGFSIVFLLMFSGVSPIKSNVIGYTIGSILSYYLNSRYTFDAKNYNTKQVIKFFIVLLVAYFLNYLTLQWMLGGANPYLAQLVSAIVYTLSSFLLMRSFVFTH